MPYWEFRRSLLANEDGVTAIEFALIASLISIAILGGVNMLGASTAEMWASIGNSV